MSYELSEQEFWNLQGCMRQAGLMEELCSHISGQAPLNVEGLYFFFRTQKAALSAILEAADERSTAQLMLNQSVSTPAIQGVSPDLLVRIMDACSGAVVDEASLVRLHQELYDATILNGESAPLIALYAALQRQGYSVGHTIMNGVAQVSITSPSSKKAPSSKQRKAPARRREGLTASA